MASSMSIESIVALFMKFNRPIIDRVKITYKKNQGPGVKRDLAVLDIMDLNQTEQNHIRLSAAAFGNLYNHLMTTTSSAGSICFLVRSPGQGTASVSTENDKGTDLLGSPNIE